MATQYEQHEVAGKNLSILHGELTDLNAIAQMMHNVRFTGFGEAKVINYTKSGIAFSNDISIQPLVSRYALNDVKFQKEMNGSHKFLLLVIYMEQIRSLIC